MRMDQVMKENTISVKGGLISDEPYIEANIRNTDILPFHFIPSTNRKTQDNHS